MSLWHAFIKPFADDAGSSYATSWTEVSRDVLDIGDVSEQLDNTQYNVGTFRVGNTKIKLRNDHGKYLDVGDVNTIFKHTRGNSLVRLTWEPGDGPLIPGFFVPGPRAIPSEQVTVFEGILSDDASASDIDAQDIDFQILGYESALAGITVPYGSLSNGQLLSAIIYACLNQAPFKTYVTVSSANISLGYDPAVDDVSDLQNRTVQEALKGMLLIGNAVLYIRSGVVYVSPRTAGSSLAYSFYGMGSHLGMENLYSIQKTRTGINRLINYVTWRSTTVVAQDATSIAQNGVRKQEIDSKLITNATKQGNVVAAIKNEFYTKKREFDLIVPMKADTLALYLLDRCQVDYPSPALQLESQLSRDYGTAEYGVDYYADSLYALTIEASARFKIMSRKIGAKGESITFGMREI